MKDPEPTEFSSRRADPALRASPSLSARQRLADIERLDAAMKGLHDAIHALVTTCRDDDVFRTAMISLVEAELLRFRRLSSLGATLRLRPSNRWSGQFYRAIARATDHAAFDNDDAT